MKKWSDRQKMKQEVVREKSSSQQKSLYTELTKGRGGYRINKDGSISTATEIQLERDI